MLLRYIAPARHHRGLLLIPGSLQKMSAATKQDLADRHLEVMPKKSKIVAPAASEAADPEPKPAKKSKRPPGEADEAPVPKRRKAK